MARRGVQERAALGSVARGARLGARLSPYLYLSALNRGFTAMESQNGLDTSCTQVNRPHGGSTCDVECDELLYFQVECVVKVPL